VIPKEPALTEEGTNKWTALQWLDIAPGAQTERQGGAGPVRFVWRRTRTGRLLLIPRLFVCDCTPAAFRLAANSDYFSKAERTNLHGLHFLGSAGLALIRFSASRRNACKSSF
jgi:hypothetical protein